MKKICMVVPYFGKLPQSFNFFLLSCAYNPDVDWLLLTDDDRPLPYPENVHGVVMSFDALRARFQTKFSFPLSLERPYKLRDYRPAYGFLLEEELRGYDFWGCCDVDMMFGDIGVFITEDMLSRYDQIGRMGHFSLYRNTPEINLLFTAAAGEEEPYRRIFTTEENCMFDEWGAPGIRDLFRQAGKPTCDLDCIADISPDDSYFRTAVFQPEKQRWSYGKENCMGCWDRGRAFLMWKKGSYWKNKEVLYLHFPKRNMEQEALTEDACYIIPDKFVSTEYSIERLYTICRNRQLWNKARWQKGREGLRERLAKNSASKR